ncbi:ARID DNA-binding domain-containing protein [Tanacetum coccineum]
MVISKSFLERRWSRPSSSAFGLPNMWYQSKLGRPLRRRQQYDFIQRQLRREKEAQFGTCIRQITQDYKEMLRKKMEEIEQYNSTINQPYSNNILQNRHKRYKCFKCRQIGHVMKNCPVKKHDEGTTYSTKVNTFNEYVAFLNLLKQDEIISQEWETFRSKFDRVVKWFYEKYLEKPMPGPIPPKINGVTIHLIDLYKLVESFGGYLSVYFAREFGKIEEILGLSIQDGEEVRKCCINFLDVFTSYYKTTRVPKQEHNTVLSMPTQTIEKGKEYTCLAFHQCDFGDNQAPNKEAASTKGKEKIEHFGIILEDARRDEDSHQIQPISPNIKRSQTKDKDLQGMIKTSIISDKTDTNSRSSDDFTVIP